MSTLPGAGPTLATLQSDVEGAIQRLGLMYRLFGRAKSRASIARKVAEKKYSAAGRKLQDAIGLRVVVYFPEDCEIVQQAVERSFEVADRSIDEPASNEFGPRRLNLVLRAEPAKWMVLTEGLPVDSTFELQVRTVLSEGWHEVEHDLRYKCSSDWLIDPGAGRTLNGTLGALETAEWAMGSLFDSLAFRHYRSAHWEPMLRHKFRLRLEGHLSPVVSDVLTSEPTVAKALWKADRGRLLRAVASTQISLPWNFDNLVFWVEAVEGLGSTRLQSLRPRFVAQTLDTAFELASRGRERRDP